MIKRFAYIVALLLFTASLSFASASLNVEQQVPVPGAQHPASVHITIGNDTTKTRRVTQNRMDVLDHSTIKEVPKTKRQPKPEKVADNKTTEKAATPADTANKKQRSKRRPEGLERPPDIIRRNN